MTYFLVSPLRPQRTNEQRIAADDAIQAALARRAYELDAVTDGKLIKGGT
jgi:hypothetical protein